VAVLGPVALHLAAAVFGGLKLRDIWGAPLWTFAGLLLVTLRPATMGRRAWRRFGWCWLAALAISTTLFALGGLAGAARDRASRIHCPGRELAAEVCRLYAEQCGGAPAVIAGDWWLAGSVCCLAPHRPALYGSREPAGPGMNLAALKGDP